MAEGDEIVGNEPETVRLADTDRVGDQRPKRRDSLGICCRPWKTLGMRSADAMVLTDIAGPQE